MALVHLNDMLNHAYHHNYAVGAFGVVDLRFLSGIMQAAENCRAPVVLNLIEAHFCHYDFELLMPAVLAAAKRATVPVAINFDHGISHEHAERAIRAGCNGVMVDTSMLPFSDNLWQTRELVNIAHSCGVTVEGELGYVPGVAGESAKLHPGELSYTSAAEAAGFVERTGVDSLAVSIGTVHGRMKGVPKLDYNRLAKIHEATSIPLVIHGGTGLSDEQYRKLISHGVAKINYYTALAEVAARSVREQCAADRKADYGSLPDHVSEVVRVETERCMRLWGAGGRAAEVLAQCRPWAEVRQLTLFNLSSGIAENEVPLVLRETAAAIAKRTGVRRVHMAKTAQDRYSLMVDFASREAMNNHRKRSNELSLHHKLLMNNMEDLLILELQEQ